MTEQEYIDISNLARLRVLASAAAWLLPLTPKEKTHAAALHAALADWVELLEKKTDGLVRG